MANYKHGGKTKKMADGGYAVPPKPMPEAPPPTPPIPAVPQRTVASEMPKTVTPPTPKIVTPPTTPERRIVDPRPGASDMAMPKRRVPVMPRRGSAQMMAEGGSVGSASKRADGCAQRGKTKGKMY